MPGLFSLARGAAGGAGGFLAQLFIQLGIQAVGVDQDQAVRPGLGQQERECDPVAAGADAQTAIARGEGPWLVVEFGPLVVPAVEPMAGGKLELVEGSTADAFPVADDAARV